MGELPSTGWCKYTNHSQSLKSLLALTFDCREAVLGFAEKVWSSRLGGRVRNVGFMAYAKLHSQHSHARRALQQPLFNNFEHLVR